MADHEPTPRTVVKAWDVPDGGLVGALIECASCGGSGLRERDTHATRWLTAENQETPTSPTHVTCVQCSGSGDLFRPYQYPGQPYPGHMINIADLPPKRTRVEEEPSDGTADRLRDVGGQERRGTRGRRVVLIEMDLPPQWSCAELERAFRVEFPELHPVVFGEISGTEVDSVFRKLRQVSMDTADDAPLDDRMRSASQALLCFHAMIPDRLWSWWNIGEGSDPRRSVMVPVGSDVLAELEEWSPPIEAKAERVDGQWAIQFRASPVLDDLRALAEQVEIPSQLGLDAGEKLQTDSVELLRKLVDKLLGGDS